jgi:hypothetical protein
VGWEIAPSTICFHHMDDCLEYEAPIMVVGMPDPSDWWEQWFEPLPHHVQHLPLNRLLRLRLLAPWFIPRNCSFLAPTVLVIARPDLMPAPPPRPGQHCRGMPLDCQDQLPKQPTNFTTA